MAGGEEYRISIRRSEEWERERMVDSHCGHVSSAITPRHCGIMIVIVIVIDGPSILFSSCSAQDDWKQMDSFPIRYLSAVPCRANATLTRIAPLSRALEMGWAIETPGLDESGFGLSVGVL